MDKKRVLGAVLCLWLVFVGIWVWWGSLLVLIALSLCFLPLLLISVPILFLKLNDLISYALNGSIFSSQPIMEEMPLVGATPTIFLWIWLNKIPKKWILPTLFLFIIGMIKVKYMFLAVPLMAMGLLVVDNANQNLKFFGKYKWVDLVLLSLACSIAFGFMAFQSEPTQEQFNLIELAIVQQKDLNIPLYNDWSTGWWFENKGFDTNFKSSYPEPDYNNLPTPYIAFTMYDINKNCLEKQKTGKYKLLHCQ